MSLTFWDVQHGHATYIKSPNDKHIVIDLGTGTISGTSDIFCPLQFLKRNGVNRLDYCIITHPHMDHIDDIFNFYDVHPKVLQRPRHIPDERLVEGARQAELPKINKYLEIHHDYTRLIETDDVDYPFDSNKFGGMRIQTFAPINCSISNLNNQSIVSVFEYAETKVVIPGDNESPSWNELLQNVNFVEAIRNADIFLASHHGRESGYHEQIMNIINPKITIISDAQYHQNSVRDRYSAMSSGWIVWDAGQETTRKTLSTYYDGVIKIDAGYNSNGKPYLQVRV
jgi:beta-lactamase superfamily II metal-dependent hydrolase